MDLCKSLGRETRRAIRKLMKYQVLGNKGLNKGGNENEKVGSDAKNKCEITYRSISLERHFGKIVSGTRFPGFRFRFFAAPHSLCNSYFPTRDSTWATSSESSES